MKKDRARTRIGRISSLGLVEMTRKRTGESVTEALTSVCPTCVGRGRVPSSDTISLWVERDGSWDIRAAGGAIGGNRGEWGMDSRAAGGQGGSDGCVEV